ncbi:nicotinamide riboside transporter PnuC [Rheinheimera tilapiae]|jgi:nicotinamide mononucleotide transporter|uniref:Nicotinamide riboside transporter PnuC n=1 Tax=Rheinheimera tilapiae TaxID=875043 RepID=A0ABV6BIG9_9GAMM
MTELWQQLLNQWQLQTALELIATVLALSYTVLAIRHSLWCWPAALASTVLTLQIMLSANLYTDALLQLYYAGMALYGWWNWQQLRNQSGLAQQVVEWRGSQHLRLISLTALAGLLLGYLMQQYTSTDFAWLGAQISCFAVVTTYLVAKKVVSNWLYWIVIDAASIYMYLQKDLYFFSALFVIYTLTAASGYFAWRSNYRQQQLNNASGICASG